MYYIFLFKIFTLAFWVALLPQSKKGVGPAFCLCGVSMFCLLLRRFPQGALLDYTTVCYIIGTTY